jgi:hypothetical protein
MPEDAPTNEWKEDQPGERRKVGRKTLTGVIAALALAAILAGLWLARQPEKDIPSPAEPTAKKSAALKVKDQLVIEYNKAEQNRLMKERKATFGVKEGLDMIVKEGESIKVGDQTVSVEEISRTIQAKEGGITEKDLTTSVNTGSGAYGIYVVQPGDNIWNIHFKLLKAYLTSKNITLPDKSDEPDRSGFSSGIGKLLKFSESMVYIYNIRDRQLSADINVIRPLTKIVIYKMDRIFELLDQVDYHNVNRLKFDGENIWIPAG